MINLSYVVNNVYFSSATLILLNNFLSSQIPSGLPRNLEAAVQRYGSATYKATAATVLDSSGKPSMSLTYGKLLGRSHKIAYNLLNKVGPKGNPAVRPGDRVSEKEYLKKTVFLFILTLLSPLPSL